MMWFMCALALYYRSIDNRWGYCCRHMDATNRFILSEYHRKITLTNCYSAHFTGRFLPWHRLYLHTMEGLLRDQCGYNGHMTYWDWTIGESERQAGHMCCWRETCDCDIPDSHDIKHSPIFNADPSVGLGTFPDASSNFELDNGAFRDILRAYPVPHHIQRNYTLRVCFCALTTCFSDVELHE